MEEDPKSDEGSSDHDSASRWVLQMAQEESRRLGNSFLGTEHLLLALVGQEDGVSARVLSNLGVDLANVRSEVMRLLAST